MVDTRMNKVTKQRSTRIRTTNFGIGIDSIAFSTSCYFLSLETFAEHRNVDYKKYSEGIGQLKMAIFPPTEDIVTMAVDAAQRALAKFDTDERNKIGLLVFATESSFDLSKSAGIYVHRFLNLRSECRVFDVKQACYSTTAALRIAENHIRCHKCSKVLVIGSDIVRYSAGSSGEPTQGGAAIAMVISENPRIACFEPFSGVHTEDVADFWRPASKTEARFDGKLSAHNYLKSLEYCLEKYEAEIGKSAYDFVNYSCFHSPFCKMAIKAARQSFPQKNIGLEKSLQYNALIGNSCSASLYIGFLSLIDNTVEDLSGLRVGMYSYGSGSVAEYFSLRISEKYKATLNSNDNRKILENRLEVSWEEYERLQQNRVNFEEVNNYDYRTRGPISLVSAKEGYRKYIVNEETENTIQRA